MMLSLSTIQRLWAKREWVAGCGLLVLAAGLRLGAPELTEFKRDEAQLYGLALEVAEFKAFPLHGIGSSVGLPNSPISVYVLALPLFFWKSPLAATLFVGALNTASVALAHVMARRYWGARAGLVAAGLYAASPWAIIYSRKIWAQDLLPLFVVAYIFAALLAFVEGRRRWVIAHLSLLAVIVQIHLSGLALIPLTLMLLLIFRRRVDWRMAGWGTAAALATLTPFMIYVLMQGDRGIGALFTLVSRPAEFSAEAFGLAALVMTGTQIHSLAGAQAFRTFLGTVPNFDALLYYGGGLTLSGAGYALWRWTKLMVHGPEDETRVGAEAGLVLALWLALPVLFFVRHSTPIYPHYFILLFPVPYLLAGMLLGAMMSRRALRGIAVVSALALTASQVWLVAALWRFIGAQATPGAFGTPLGMILQTVQEIRLPNAPDVVIVSDGDSVAFDEVPAVFHVLLRDRPHRFVDGRTTAVLPETDAVIVLWPGAQPYPGEALYRRWGGGDWLATVPLREGEGEVYIALGRGVTLETPRPREASALLSNGAEVLGSGGDAQLWELWWRVPDGDPGEQYTIFAHLLTGAGERVAQADLPTYPAASWRAGDLVASYFPLGSAGAAVRAGMYASASLRPVEVLDVAGNPSGQWLEFPLP